MCTVHSAHALMHPHIVHTSTPLALLVRLFILLPFIKYNFDIDCLLLHCMLHVCLLVLYIVHERLLMIVDDSAVHHGARQCSAP